MKRKTSTKPPADASRDSALVAQVRKIVHSIPPGRVMSYGAIGARCKPAISGYICGRIMQSIGEGNPWWRVVGKQGNLPVSKTREDAGHLQRQKLEEESVEFDEAGHVIMAKFAVLD